MTIGLIGAPSSAAGHWPGMEKAPAFLRLAGLPERLRDGGVRLVDHGDLPHLRWRPDPEHPRAQNLPLVVDYLRDVADRVDEAVSHGELPVVVGGECTLTLGAVVGLLRHYEDLGLMYVDGHVDLNTPESTASGVLDSMGMAHVFARAGTLAELSRIAPRSPLLDPRRVVYFGYNENDMNAVEVEQLPTLPVTAYPLSRIGDDVAAHAREALATLESSASAFVLHLDVDVISFTDFPIADVPTYHEGLTFDQAMECVGMFASSAKCAAVLVTEVNPDHSTEAEGKRFAAGLAHALRRVRASSRA